MANTTLGIPRYIHPIGNTLPWAEATSNLPMGGDLYSLNGQGGQALVIARKTLQILLAEDQKPSKNPVLWALRRTLSFPHTLLFTLHCSHVSRAHYLLLLPPLSLSRSHHTQLLLLLQLPQWSRLVLSSSYQSGQSQWVTLFSFLPLASLKLLFPLLSPSRSNSRFSLLPLANQRLLFPFLCSKQKDSSPSPSSLPGT